MICSGNALTFLPGVLGKVSPTQWLNAILFQTQKEVYSALCFLVSVTPTLPRMAAASREETWSSVFHRVCRA